LRVAQQKSLVPDTEYLCFCFPSVRGPVCQGPGAVDAGLRVRVPDCDFGKLPDDVSFVVFGLEEVKYTCTGGVL
jgi:hypothetical protein